MDDVFYRSVSTERLLAGSSLSERKTQPESSSKMKTPPSKNRSRSKSRGSKKSKKKNLAKGLSPPKETPRRCDEDKVSGDFDTTQWERTRWAEEMKSSMPGMRRVKTRQRKSTDRRGTTPSRHVQDKPESKSNGLETDKKDTGTLVPGEARQIEQVRGEHLKQRPVIPIVLLSIETVFCAITASVWGAAAVNPILPFILALVNILLAFGLAVTIFFVEMCRFQVKHEETGTRITRYHIPYSWRFSLLGMHFGRLILICASITIVALDNDFDGGSIAVLALQPLHFLIIGVQIIVLMLPKRKE